MEKRYYAYGTWAMKDTEMCATCAYYIQHWAERDGAFTPICAGHCTQGRRIKNRMPHDLCENYSQSEEVQDELYIPKGFGYGIKSRG